MKEPIMALTKTVFKGFGQIMLQNNALTGFLFFIAICYASPLVGIAALISNICALFAGKWIGCKDSDINQGLLGFNASLIGIAMISYFQSNIWVWATIVMASILSAVVMKICIEKKFPYYTFPFIILTWVALFILSIPELALPTVPEVFVDIDEIDDFLIEGHAFGQVMFQGNFNVGIIFFIGVFISSPIAALYAFVAVMISVSITHHGDLPDELIKNGTYSFNAVLCGIAMSGTRVRDGLYVVLSVVFATVMDIQMIERGWATLTFPFVFAMWAILPFKALEGYLLKINYKGIAQKLVQHKKY